MISAEELLKQWRECIGDELADRLTAEAEQGLIFGRPIEIVGKVFSDDDIARAFSDESVTPLFPDEEDWPEEIG